MLPGNTRKIFMLIVVVFALALGGFSVYLIYSALSRPRAQPKSDTQQPKITSPTTSPAPAAKIKELKELFPRAEQLSFTDSDNDLLFDDEERAYGTDPNKQDTDGDGYLDGEEVANGYDPLKPGSARLDSDGDGLLDHEERRWGTNPWEKDTDGDGYTDKEEVLAQHDPLNPNAPEDRLAPTPTLAEIPQGNITAVYLILKKKESLADIPKDEVLAFVQNLPLNTDLNFPRNTEINVSLSVSKNLGRNYLEAIKLPPQVIDPITVNNDLARLAQGDTLGVRTTAETLERQAAELRAMQIPADALELHKHEIAFLESLASAFREMSAFPEDPLRGLLGYERYRRTVARYAPTLARMEEEYAAKYEES
jgi:hypothetical protein